MARARQIKMKFAAFTLHLEGMDEIQRAAKSSEHADSMIALIGSAALSVMDKDDVLNSILVAPNRNVWVASDLSRLVAAVDAHGVKRRRSAQVCLENLLFYMLHSEWDKWKANAVQGCENTATELIQRIKSVGSKNICEYSKKRAASIWLFLRGDARSLGNSARATLREQFTQKLSRSVRDFEPLEYILELPKPSVFERDHNQMWLRAFPVETPSPIAEADLNEVLFIDGLFQCRGGNRPQSFEVGQPQMQLQPTMNTMNPMDIMNFAMQQFQMMCQQSTNCPNLTVYRPPVGRPMRSIQNMKAMQLPSLLDGRSENAGAGAHTQIQDADAGAGGALVGKAAESTHMTSYPPLPPPADSPMSAPPSPKLAASDERDAVEVTLKRMLERGKSPAATETVESAAAAGPATPMKKPAASCKKNSKWQKKVSSSDSNTYEARSQAAHHFVGNFTKSSDVSNGIFW